MDRQGSISDTAIMEKMAHLLYQCDSNIIYTNDIITYFFFLSQSIHLFTLSHSFFPSLTLFHLFSFSLLLREESLYIYIFISYFININSRILLNRMQGRRDRFQYPSGPFTQTVYNSLLRINLFLLHIIQYYISNIVTPYMI